jgi:hypothetical protein
MSSVTADSAFGPSFALNVAAIRDCDDDLRFDSAQSGMIRSSDPMYGER